MAHRILTRGGGLDGHWSPNALNLKQMAIITGNNLGRLKKKSGPNVFRKWRTHQVMSVYNSEVRNPNTDGQKVVRYSFASATRLAAAFSSAIMVGFENVCKGTKTPQRGYFVKENWGCFHSDNTGSVTVDYDNLVISKGDLPQILFGNATFTNPLEVDVPITDDASAIGANANDIAYVFVYSPEAGAGILSASKKRTDPSVAINVPAYWNGHRVHVFGFAKGADANTINPGDLSDSRYLGSGTIS